MHMGLPRKRQAHAETRESATAYLTALLTLLKVSPMLVPSARAPPMMATAIRAAIKPYSMAVAPDSSFKNCLSMSKSPFLPFHCPNARLAPFACGDHASPRRRKAASYATSRLWVASVKNCDVARTIWYNARRERLSWAKEAQVGHRVVRWQR